LAPRSKFWWFARHTTGAIKSGNGAHAAQPQFFSPEVSMEAYQERVIAEKRELDEKIEKLNTWLEKHWLTPGPNPYDFGLLIRQFVFMTAYSEVLGARIATFSQSPAGNNS
jgi:hypothetical protein